MLEAVYGVSEFSMARLADLRALSSVFTFWSDEDQPEAHALLKPNNFNTIFTHYSHIIHPRGLITHNEVREAPRIHILLKHSG